MVYYRRRVLSNFWDALTLGILPLASVVFLGYVAVKSILSAPGAQNYSLLGFAVVGIILLFIARFGLKSSFFQIKRESWSPETEKLTSTGGPQHRRG
jgi:predicted acyltransferase